MQAKQDPLGSGKSSLDATARLKHRMLSYIGTPQPASCHLPPILTLIGTWVSRCLLLYL